MNPNKAAETAFPSQNRQNCHLRALISLIALSLPHSNFCIPFTEGLAPAVPAIFPFLCSLFSGSRVAGGDISGRKQDVCTEKREHKNGNIRIRLQKPLGEGNTKVGMREGEHERRNLPSKGTVLSFSIVGQDAMSLLWDAFKYSPL